MESTGSIINAGQLSKSFGDGELKVDVLTNVELKIHSSERIAVIGASGSGKSTLLHLLGGLEAPDTGEVVLCGHQLNKVSDVRRGELRNEYLGFIYQFHHLLPEFTALENVALPLMVRETGLGEIKDTCRDMLERVGLEERMQHKPGELSGGERQRVAIARALITRPKLILADEPTGNLDRKSAQQVTDIMMGLNSELNTAIALVTHDLALAEIMDTVYELVDGALRKVD